MPIDSPVSFVSSGTVPPPLVSGTAYYVVAPAANSFKVAATAGGAAIDITGAGTGTITGSRVYAKGEIAKSAGINYYSMADANTNHAPPNATWWYAMPTSPNLYEIPNPYAAADLFDIHYVQSADVLTLTHPGYAPLELRRLGATNWQTPTRPSRRRPIRSPSVTYVDQTGAAPPAPSPRASGRVRGHDDCGQHAGRKRRERQPAETSARTCRCGQLRARHDRGCHPTPTRATTSTRRWSTPVSTSSYPSSNGFYGFMAQAQKDPDNGNFTFIDNNITPDISRTPPIADATAVSRPRATTPARWGTSSSGACSPAPPTRRRPSGARAPAPSRT
jgi:hypothetical protein